MLTQAWTKHKEKRRAVFVQLLTKVKRRAPPPLGSGGAANHHHHLVVAAPPGTTTTTGGSGAASPLTRRSRILRRRAAAALVNKSPLSAPRIKKTTKSSSSGSVVLQSYYDATQQALRCKLRAAMMRRRRRHAKNKALLKEWWSRRWRRATVWIDEPMQQDWFDRNTGLPLAVQNQFGRFVNPWNSESTNGMHSLFLFLRWRLERWTKFVMTLFWRRQQQQPHGGGTKKLPAAAQPLSSSTPPSPASNNDNDNTIRLTWIGHATTLVQLRGYNILTDPIFSSHTPPSFLYGIPRKVPPSLGVDDLPETIHVVVLSHDHYDHLDHPSVLALLERGVQIWAVPLGIKEWLQDYCGVKPSNIVELTWWERATLRRGAEHGQLQVHSLSTLQQQQRQPILSHSPVLSEDDNDRNNDLIVTCAPAQHWCGRTMWDRNQRLWCSWAVQAGPLKFYFGGDTGLPPNFPLHRQIGDHLGPFDLAALPIGAYEPRYFMKTSHVHPREAVQIHRDIQAKQSVAIHWGTFPLAEEEDGEARRLLREAAEEAGVDFVMLPPGGVLETAAKEKKEVQAIVVVEDAPRSSLTARRRHPSQEAAADDQAAEAEQTSTETEEQQEQHVEYG